MERAAIRWLARYCLERRGVTIEEVREAADAFARLREDREKPRRPSGGSPRGRELLYRWR